MDVGYDAPASSFTQPDYKPNIDGQMATTQLRPTPAYQASSSLQSGHTLFPHTTNQLPFFPIAHGLPNTSQYSSAPVNTSPFVQTVYRASMNQVYGKPISSQILFNNLALDFHTLAYQDEGIITSFEDGLDPLLSDDEPLPAANPVHLLGLQPSAAPLPLEASSDEPPSSLTHSDSSEAASLPLDQQADQYIPQEVSSTIGSDDILSSSLNSNLSSQFSSFHSDYDYNYSLNYAVPTGNPNMLGIKNTHNSYNLHKSQGNSFVDFAPDLSYHIPQYDGGQINYYASPNAEFMRAASLAGPLPPYPGYSFGPNPLTEARVMRQPTYHSPLPVDAQHSHLDPASPTAWSFAGQNYHVANFGGLSRAPNLPAPHVQTRTSHPQSVPAYRVLKQPAPKHRTVLPRWAGTISLPSSDILLDEASMKPEQNEVDGASLPQRSSRKLLTREEQDYVLIEERKKGVPYEEIKRKYAIDVSTEALRGRHRVLTLPPDKRVRHPTWTAYDVR